MLMPPQYTLNKGSAQVSGGPIPIHVTDLLMESESGKAASEEFQVWKDSGSPRTSAQKGNFTVGAQAIFSVQNLKTNVRENIDFTLKETSDRFNIWVETAELTSGHVRDQEIAALKAGLADETPSGSYNSAAGIIVNNETVFGNPPDKDGDSKTDILLVDVRDNFDPPTNNFFTAGFFDPTDLTPSGNNRDIVYLDTNPAIWNNGNFNSVNRLLATAAHEYQHLIEWGYDANETTFVREAQSEWAELMNGYNGRSMAFLGTEDEHKIPFFTFRSPDRLLDRERGQLFTLFASEQVDVLTAGSISRQPGNDRTGYEQALGTSDALRDLIMDFFTANLLNDTSIDPRYGYSNPFYVSKRTIVDETIDGRTTNEIPQRTVTMEPGTVEYIKLENVSDVTVSIDVSGGFNQEVNRGKIGVRALTKQGSGPYGTVDFGPSITPTDIPGTFSEVILIIVHKAPAIGEQNNVNLSYSVDWSSGTGNQFTESKQYDDGSPKGTAFIYSDSESNLLQLVQSTLFARPQYSGDIVLDNVQVAPYFLNQFGPEVDDGSARDFKLRVMADSNGEPNLDETLFSLDVVDSRPWFAGSPYVFINLSLTEYADQLNNLPEQFHIGLEDIGTDENLMVFWPSENTAQNFSFIGGRNNTSWTELWSQSPNDVSQTESVFPIRAGFLITEVVGIEEDAVATPSFELRQNYPNPFSGVTTIDIASPEPSDITVEVFDLLGRKIETVTDGFFPQGTHSIRVDASNWASGLYLYRLKAKDVTLTRTFSVINSN